MGVHWSADQRHHRIRSYCAGRMDAGRGNGAEMTGYQSKKAAAQAKLDDDAPLTLNGVALWPKRPWVGLTEDEIAECFKITPDQHLPWHIYKRIEAKLKEKNNG